MPTLKEIRLAVKDTIETGISGLKCYDKVPENALVLPAVIVEPDRASFTEAMARGTDRYDFTLIMLVGYNHLETAQDNLDPYVTGYGEKSLRQCIWNKKDLGLDGAVNAHISQMYDYGDRYAPPTQGRATEQLGARLSLVVFTRGTLDG
jgi:hypothetical protein